MPGWDGHQLVTGWGLCDHLWPKPGATGAPLVADSGCHDCPRLDICCLLAGSLNGCPQFVVLMVGNDGMELPLLPSSQRAVGDVVCDGCDVSGLSLGPGTDARSQDDIMSMWLAGGKFVFASLAAVMVLMYMLLHEPSNAWWLVVAVFTYACRQIWMFGEEAVKARDRALFIKVKLHKDGSRHSNLSH